MSWNLGMSPVVHGAVKADVLKCSVSIPSVQFVPGGYVPQLVHWAGEWQSNMHCSLFLVVVFGAASRTVLTYRCWLKMNMYQNTGPPKQPGTISLSLSLYIYIYIYIEREREIWCRAASGALCFDTYSFWANTDKSKQCARPRRTPQQGIVNNAYSIAIRLLNVQAGGHNHLAQIEPMESKLNT